MRRNPVPVDGSFFHYLKGFSKSQMVSRTFSINGGPLFFGYPKKLWCFFPPSSACECFWMERYVLGVPWFFVPWNPGSTVDQCSTPVARWRKRSGDTGGMGWETSLVLLLLTPWKINMELQNGGLAQIVFLFKWVIFKLMLTFRGVTTVAISMFFFLAAVVSCCYPYSLSSWVAILLWRSPIWRVSIMK